MVDLDIKQAGALALAVVVAVTAVAGPAAAATSTIYPTTDDAGLVAQVSWDDTNVSAGDTVNLDIVDASAGSTADTATVTVRSPGATDTYWLGSAEYQIPTSSDATTQVDVVLADNTLGSVGPLSTADAVGSQTVETGADQGVSANITIDDEAPADYQPVDVTVTAIDGGTALGSTTVAADNSSAAYAELNATELDLSSTTNVTVAITGVVDGQGNDFAGDMVTSYSVSTFGGDGGGAGAGDTSSGDTQMYVVGGVAVVLVLLLVRD